MNASRWWLLAILAPLLAGTHLAAEVTVMTIDIARVYRNFTSSNIKDYNLGYRLSEHLS